MEFVTGVYADFKLIAAQFTSGHVFFFDGVASQGVFKIWGMAASFPVLICSLTARPATFATDFPSAIQIAQPLSTVIG